MFNIQVCFLIHPLPGSETSTGCKRHIVLLCLVYSKTFIAARRSTMLVSILCPWACSQYNVFTVSATEEERRLTLRPSGHTDDLLDCSSRCRNNFVFFTHRGIYRQRSKNGRLGHLEICFTSVITLSNVQSQQRPD